MISSLLVPARRVGGLIDPFITAVDDDPNHGRLPVAGWELLRNAHGNDLVLMVMRNSAYWRWRPSYSGGGQADIWFLSDGVPTEGEASRLYECDQIEPDGYKTWSVVAGSAPRGRLLGWSYKEVGYALATGPEGMMLRLHTFLTRFDVRG